MMNDEDLVYLLTVGEMIKHPHWGIESCFSAAKGNAQRVRVLFSQTKMAPEPEPIPPPPHVTQVNANGAAQEKKRIKRERMS